MTITKTIDIPATGQRMFEVPAEVPPGKTILTFTPATTAKNPRMTEEQEKAYFELHADELNAEAEDVLSYQNMFLDELDK